MAFYRPGIAPIVFISAGYLVLSEIALVPGFVSFCVRYVVLGVALPIHEDVRVPRYPLSTFPVECVLDTLMAGGDRSEQTLLYLIVENVGREWAQTFVHPFVRIPLG